MSKWTSVAEQLPRNEEYVKMLYGDGDKGIGYWDGGLWWLGYEHILEDEEAVTHWAPIDWPMPPEEAP